MSPDKRGWCARWLDYGVGALNPVHGGVPCGVGCHAVIGEHTPVNLTHTFFRLIPAGGFEIACPDLCEYTIFMYIILPILVRCVHPGRDLVCSKIMLLGPELLLCGGSRTITRSGGLAPGQFCGLIVPPFVYG